MPTLSNLPINITDPQALLTSLTQLQSVLSQLDTLNNSELTSLITNLTNCVSSSQVQDGIANIESLRTTISSLTQELTLLNLLLGPLAGLLNGVSLPAVG